MAVPNSYSMTIPALAPVGNPNVRIPQAPDIAANTPLDVAHVDAATEEYRARKELRRHIDQEEVTAAKLRKIAVESEHAAHQYPTVGAPAWATQIQQQVQQIQQQMQQMQQQMQQMQQQMQLDIQGLQGDLRSMEARTAVRLQNSVAVSVDHRIELLPAMPGRVLPTNVPATVQALRTLNRPTTNALLRAYEINVQADMDEDQCRLLLGRYLGVAGLR